MGQQRKVPGRSVCVCVPSQLWQRFHCDSEVCRILSTLSIRDRSATCRRQGKARQGKASCKTDCNHSSRAHSAKADSSAPIHSLTDLRWVFEIRTSVTLAACRAVGQVGCGKKTRHVREPRQIPLGETVGACRAVCCGHNHTLLLSMSGKVYAVGEGQYGQLGLTYFAKEVRCRCISTVVWPQKCVCIEYSRRVTAHPRAK